jgi:steroid delta-isomerase-like uncharacterized protein
MAIAAVFTPRSMNGFQYDLIMRRLGAAGAGAPSGRLYHVCFGTGDKLRFLEVWESKAAFDGFLKTLGSVIQQVGVETPPPGIVQTYNFILGGTSVTDNAAVVRDVNHAFNQGDIYGCVEHFAAHAQITDTPLGKVLSGREAIRQWFEAWTTAFDDVQGENLRILSQGTFVTAQFNARGTHTGPLATPAGEIPATGKRVDISVCQVFELHAGMIVRGTNYYDAATLLNQLGVGALGRAPAEVTGSSR